TLTYVKKVEYYFGRHWGGKIFTSIDKAKGFPIATSAFGPFGCTAKVFFTDGHETILFRYIDFEMGQLMKTN
ncbi:MAG: pYEATS domain-containing protein, partial [Promethearchaeota archaeon]